MDYTTYATSISFRLIQPSHKMPRGFHKTTQLFQSLGLSLEMANTKIPENEREMKKRLRKICQIPKMSTFAIAALINQGIAQMPESQAFVNVGVWNGFTFLAGMANHRDKKCIGVDNFSQFGGPKDDFLKRFYELKSDRHFFYDLDYEEYFAKIHQEPIGFYIYDGEHSYENQLKGLKIAEPFFAKNCLVLVDDTRKNDPKQATLDFIRQSPHQYQTILDCATFHNGHPTFWNGIMLFQKVS